MESSPLIIQTVYELFVEYGWIIMIIGVFLLGESVSIAVFALAGMGFIGPSWALILVFTGSMLADIFWFYMAEFVFRERFEKFLIIRQEKKTFSLIVQLLDRHFFWILIMIKFMMGLRLILTIYIALRMKVPFIKKIFINGLGTILYLSVLFPIGWYLGKGVQLSFAGGQNAYHFIPIIIILVGIIIILPRIIIMHLKKIKHTH